MYLCIPEITKVEFQFVTIVKNTKEMEKEIKTFEPRVLFDSTKITYDDYKKWAEDCGKEPNMDDYWDWYGQELMCGQDYVDGYFQRESVIDKAVYVFGSLGVWDGRREIEPVKLNNWNMAMRKMLSEDIEDYRITQISDYEFTFEAYHHEGRNEFHFRFLKEGNGYQDGQEVDLSDLSIFEKVHLCSRH